MLKIVDSGFSRELYVLAENIAVHRLAARPEKAPRPAFLIWLKHEAPIRESTAKGPLHFDDDCRCAILLMLKHHGNRMGFTEGQLADVETCTSAENPGSAFYRSMLDHDLTRFIDPVQYALHPAYRKPGGPSPA